MHTIDFDTRLMLAGGHWKTCAGGQTLELVNPSDETPLAHIARGGAADVDAAVAAAQAALAGDWGALAAAERGRVLMRISAAVTAQAETLARLEALDVGKPLSQARADARALARYLEFYAGAADKVHGQTIPFVHGTTALTIREPHGVTGHIVPWNYPMQIIGRSVGAALAMGNACVLKPAEEACLTALAFARIAQDAGLPAGALNVVPGLGEEAGAALAAHPGVQHLSFTGSVGVGRLIQAAAAKHVVPVTLELGGKSPQIVFDDADLDAAIQGAMISKYRNSGQTCVCSNRIFVQDGVYDAFVEKLVAATAALNVGDGMQDGITIGPLVNEKAAADVDKLVQASIAQGATVALGGGRHELGGCYYQPTVLTGVNSQMAVFRNEIFGPVAPVVRFSTEEEVIAMANDTEFGLASYFYTRDIGRVWRVAEALDYGIVGINEGIISNEMAPFGGVKESGSGREGSKYGIDDYVEVKYMLMGGL